MSADKKEAQVTARTMEDTHTLRVKVLAGGAVLAVVAGLFGGAMGASLVSASEREVGSGSAEAVETLGYQAALAADEGRLLEALCLARLAANAIGPIGEGVPVFENLLRERILSQHPTESHERATLCELAQATGVAAGVVDEDNLKMRLIALQCEVLEHARDPFGADLMAVTGALPSSKDALGALQQAAVAPLAQEARTASEEVRLGDSRVAVDAAPSPVPTSEKGDPPLAFIEAAVGTTTRPEFDRLLDGAVAQLLAWPGEAEALITTVTDERLLERLDPVEGLEWLQRFMRTLDDVAIPEVRSLGGLERARDRAEARMVSIANDMMVESALLMRAFAEELNQAPGSQAALAMLDAAEVFELESPLFELGLLFEDSPPPMSAPAAGPGQDAAADLLCAIMESANKRLDELEAQITEILDSERQPNEIKPADAGSLGRAATVIESLDRLGTQVVLLPLADLPLIDPLEALSEMEAFQDRLTAAYQRAVELQQVRYETWALSQTFQAVEHSEWPEMLGQIEQAVLSPPTAALWNTTLSDRLGALSDPSQRYLSASRQLRAEKVSPDRL